MNNRPRDTDLGPSAGEVKFFNQQKGFGFLIADGREVFFHVTGIMPNQDQQEVKEGAEVTFRLWKQHPDNAKGNGLKATELTVTKLAPQ